MTSLVGLHCCFAPQGRPVVLACRALENDAIIRVEFATYANASDGPWFCGEEVRSSCAADLASRLEHCLGQQRCEVNENVVGAPDACLGLGDKEFIVRWTCRNDDISNTIEPVAMLPPLPLRAAGGVVLDADGSRVRLTGVNWAGAHVTNAPAGLDRAPVHDIARLIRQLGFNIVRLTWSVENVLSNPFVQPRLVAANPQLRQSHRGVRALDVLDLVVYALAREGVMVWLDNHMLDTDWCCDARDCNAFWYNSNHTESDWHEAIRHLSKRYLGTPAVVGMGLKNEPRSMCGGRAWGGQGGFCDASFFDPNKDSLQCVEMQWSSGPESLRLRPAMERAGRVALDVNPHLLIGVGGLDYASDLVDIANYPIELPKENLVYEAHEYSWFKHIRYPFKRFPRYAGHDSRNYSIDDAFLKCDELGDNICKGITCDSFMMNCTLGAGNSLEVSSNDEVTFRKKYGEHFDGYSNALDSQWGYLARKGIAPVFVTEFGMGQDFRDSPDASSWFENFSQYLQTGGPLRGGLDWAYWEISGEQVGGTSRKEGSTETFGVLNHCWTAPANQSHIAALRSLMAPLQSTEDGGGMSGSGGLGKTENRSRLNWLYVVFVSVFISGCVLWGVWHTARMRRRQSDAQIELRTVSESRHF